MLFFGLGQGVRRVGEDRVVPPGGEQLALARGGLAVEVLDPADDEPAVIACPFLKVNAVYGTLAIWAPQTQRPGWSSQMARG